MDCASVFIAFAAAPGFHIGNFPWALLNLLVVLVFADTTVLLYPYLKRRYGASYARGWCLATGGYYLLTMVLTPLFYWADAGPVVHRHGGRGPGAVRRRPWRPSCSPATSAAAAGIPR